MIKEFPPEAFTIKCLDDAMELLNTDDGQKRFEGHLKAWMKKIQVYCIVSYIKVILQWLDAFLVIDCLSTSAMLHFYVPWCRHQPT